MPEILVPVELTDARASAGRAVLINVPVLYPPGASASALSSATARARQELQKLVEDGRSTMTPLPTGSGADLTVEGRLLFSSPSVWIIRQQAYGAAERGADDLGFSWHGVGPEDVSVLDLDTPPVEKSVYGPGQGFFDTQGQVNFDGTVNYGAVLEQGTQEGLDNFGEGVGAVAGAVGQGASSAVGGFFGGLGFGWSVVLILVLIVAALLALSFAFGGPRLL